MATIRLIEIHARNLATGQDEVLRYASGGGYMSAPTDVPPHAWYADRAKTSLNFERSLFQDRAAWGRSSVGRGVIVLANDDGALDHLDGYAYDGRPVEILEGDESAPRTVFNVVFKGVCELAEVGMEQVTLRLRDALADLDKPVQDILYAGSNSGPDGVEGLPGDLKGNPKPLVYGRCLNVPVVAVNSSSLIGQVHDGPVQAITAVYDRGAAITPGADYPDLAALQAATVAGGAYATCRALGLIRLGMRASGQVTADVQGDASGSGYVTTTARILLRLLARAGITDIDQAAFDILDAAAPATVGLYLGAATTYLDACDALCSGVLAWYAPTAAGRWTVGRLQLPAGPGVATIDEVSRSPRLERQSARTTSNGLPAWRVTVRYARNWCVLGADGIAGAVDPTRAAWLAQEWRTAVADDQAVRATYPHATEITLDTPLVNQADAEALAAAVLAIARVRRDFWRISVPPYMAAGIDLGQVVSLWLPRLGLDAGRPLLVTGTTVDYGLGHVALTLWG